MGLERLLSEARPVTPSHCVCDSSRVHGRCCAWPSGAAAPVFACATRLGRIDGKYLLGLELADPGLDASVLREVRSRLEVVRLVASGAQTLLLDTSLTLWREHRLRVPQGRQGHGQHACAWGRPRPPPLGLRCWDDAGGAEHPGRCRPDWLRLHADPAWTECCGKPADDCRIPLGEAARQAYAEGIGRDGHALLAAVAALDAPAWLREVPAVMLLRVASPYDPDVRHAKERSTTWSGYKVHLTQAGDDERPHLVSHVETTPAPVVDGDALGPVQGSLATKDLLPRQHLVDTGCVGLRGAAWMWTKWWPARVITASG